MATIVENGQEMEVTEAEAAGLVKRGFIYRCGEADCCGNYHVVNERAGYPDSIENEKRMWGNLETAAKATEAK